MKSLTLGYICFSFVYKILKVFYTFGFIFLPVKYLACLLQECIIPRDSLFSFPGPRLRLSVIAECPFCDIRRIIHRVFKSKLLPENTFHLCQRLV